MDAVKQNSHHVAADMWHYLNNVLAKDIGIHPSAVLLILVIIGVGTLALYANIQNTSDILKGKTGAAIGTGLTPKQNQDGPPLPQPTEIVSLRIYPIKSCRGIELSSTRLRRTGLSLDRNWMFIDRSKRQFMTIRGDSSMTLIDTKIIQDDSSEKDKAETKLQVGIHGKDRSVTIPAFPTTDWLEKNTTLSTVEIWGKETDAWEYGPEINDMFCEFFGKDVALVYKGPTARNVAVNGKPELYGKETPHHFADVMSLQVASEASIADLNRRLGHEPSGPDALTIERFRPNIIVKGTVPWEEDGWKRIRVSTTLPAQEALYKIDLDVVARCARCQVPNVNPDTADKDPRQPWDTLMKFRRVDGGGAAKYKPCFGMLCIPRNEGLVAVGAKVECLETTANHVYDTAKFSDL